MEPREKWYSSYIFIDQLGTSMITIWKVPPNSMSATMLNSTWNISTQLLLAVAHLYGSRIAGSNYTGTEVYL